MNPYHDESVIKEILLNAKTIAVIGLSAKEDRPSYRVGEYLAQFYNIVAINPALSEWKGHPAYPSLSAVPQEVRIDIVDVFRRSDEVKAVLPEVLARGVPALWLQKGVVDLETAQEAAAQGIKVVMDACMAVAHSALVRER